MDKQVRRPNKWRSLIIPEMILCVVVTVLAGWTIAASIRGTRLFGQDAFWWLMAAVVVLSTLGTYLISAWAFYKAKQFDVNPDGHPCEREKKMARSFLCRFMGINRDKIEQNLSAHEPKALN